MPSCISAGATIRSVGRRSQADGGSVPAGGPAGRGADREPVWSASRAAHPGGRGHDGVPPGLQVLSGRRERLQGGPLRRGHRGAYQRAVTTDSTFALGYYRLSDAADRAGRARAGPEARPSEALRFRDRLGERERRLIEAQHAWRLGQVERGRAAGRSLVADYPDDVEAWLQLGERCWCTAIRSGDAPRSRRGRRCEQVLARDPGNGEALIHLARIAYDRGKAAGGGHAGAAGAGQVSQGAEVVEYPRVPRLCPGRPAGTEAGHPADPREPGRGTAGHRAGGRRVGRRSGGAERFARWLVGAAQAPDLQGFGHRMLAQAALARGQWRRADSELEVAARFDSIPALELRSLFAALSPSCRFPRQDIVAAREAVRRWDAGCRACATKPGTPPRTVGLHRYLRLHRLGLLDTRLGDTTARAAASPGARSGRGFLPHRPFGPYAGAEHPGPCRRRRRPDRESARPSSTQRTGRPRPRCSLPRPTTGISGRSCSRDIGTGGRGAGLVRSIAERAAYELVYLAPAHLRQAEIYDRAGRARAGGEALPQVHRALAGRGPGASAGCGRERRKRLAELSPESTRWRSPNEQAVIPRCAR